MVRCAHEAAMGVRKLTLGRGSYGGYQAILRDKKNGIY
jgi:hypothetical protein